MYPEEIFHPFALKLIGLGAIGCISIFIFLIWRAKRKSGLSTLTVVVLSILFLVSLSLAVFGTQVKIVTGFSSGAADDK
jgi:hypothetical protein